MLGLCLLFFVVVSVSGLTLQVEPRTSECFYIDALKGDILNIFFDVTRGGLLDIRFTLEFYGQYLRNYLYKPGEEEGHFETTAPKDGTYQICFDNTMSRWTAKVVTFDIFIGESHEYRKNINSPDKVKVTDLLIAEDLKVLEYEADRLQREFEKAMRLQKYLQNSEKLHREVTNTSNTRSFYLALMEALILLSISLIQIFLVRRMFKGTATIPI
jgi:p24 family protein beta-1